MEFELFDSLIFFLLFLVVHSKGQDCNVRENPFDYSKSGKALGATFYIDINNPFTCHGVITKWRICYQKSPGALTDTLLIGVYQPNSDGDRFTKKGSNSIFLHLQNEECLNITADPQLVVQEGYVVAFYSSLIYIQFFDNTVNGYLFKSVAFPKSISKGVLIKTTKPYAPKIQAYIELIPVPVQPSSSALPSPTSSSTYPIPTPIDYGGIPLPDLTSNECIFGISEGFARYFRDENSTRFISYLLPSDCDGIVSRWELCYGYVANISGIHVGIWRLNENSNNLTLVQENEIVIIVPKDQHHVEPFACTVAYVNDTVRVEKGDLIGFYSLNVSMAFTDRNIKIDGNDTYGNIPLIRAIIEKDISSSFEVPTMTSISLSPSSTDTPSPTSSSSVYGVAIVGSIMAILLILFAVIFIALFGFCIFRNRFTNGSRIQPLLVSREGMVYNTNYVPFRNEEIILDNERVQLGIKRNPSYAKPMPDDDIGNMPLSLNNESSHIYESI